MKIINVHPKPVHKEFDLHLPYCAHPRKSDLEKLQNKSNTKIKLTTPQTYALNTKLLIGEDKTVVLTNNGEPLGRIEAARLAIINHLPGVRVIVKRPKNLMYKNKDKVFKKKSYKIIKNAIDRNLVDETLDYYLKNYKQLVTQPKKVFERYHGYYSYGNMLWYQYGHPLPDCPNNYHSKLHRNFEIIWQDTKSLIKKIFKENNLPLPSKINDRLVLRLVHNKKNDNIKKKKFFKHIDNSLITGWLGENPCGAKIYEFTTDEKTERETKKIDLQKLVDTKSKDIVIIPGSAWCDYFKNDTGPTWHEVSFQKKIFCDRVSLVFMLRAPEFERADYQ